MNATAPLALVLALAFAAAAHAAEPRDFCADRPGKATPPCILDAGRVQIETGLADAVIQRHGGAHGETYAIGASEIRFGLTNRLEASAAWAPLIVDHQRGSSRVEGVGDLTLGARVALSDPDAKDGVAVSAEAIVNAPTATHGLGGGGWSGGARQPIASPLAGGFSLGVTPEADVVRNAAGGGTHLAASTTVALSHGFGDTTLGAELWGQLDEDPAGHTRQASFDLTAARALGKDGQLDGGLNLALNRSTPDVEVYVGLSHRF
jgi:hypothetical protein